MNWVVLAATVAVGLAALPYLLYVLVYAWLRPAGSPAAKRAREPTVSIVLPTYNEERIVEQKLADVCSLDYPMEKVELVVVKTDCDSQVADDALREAVANLADPEVGAVTGRNAEVLGGSEVEAGYRGVQAHVQTLESHLDSTLIFHGPFSAFENDAVVPLDPNSLADDTELALKIRRGGKRVLFDPAVRYREAAHSAFSSRRRQKDRRGMGLIRLLVQHRDALGRYGRYGRVVLPFNWWFMLVSPWLLALSVPLVTAAAVSVAGLPGLAVLPALGLFVWLGQRDALGPLQALYALFDTQVSLFRASVELLRGAGDGTWEVDADLRDAYE